MNSFVQHHHGLIRFGYHCFDRIVCNVYIPRFYQMGNVVHFLKNQRQAAALTSAFFKQVSANYHSWLEEQARHAGVPIVDAPPSKASGKAAGSKIRRHDWVQPYFDQLGTRPGTAVILKAREQARVIVSDRRQHLESQTRFVNLYYFYLRDAQCGPMFLRLCPYFPFSAQICLNGNEYLAQQCRQHGLAFRQEDNAIVDCDQPERLQQLADTFSAATIKEAMENALGQWLPYFTPQERAAGYRHQAFFAQVEYCDNLIFHKRAAVDRLFERLLDHNRSIGRPDKLAIIFGRPQFRPDTRTGQTHVKITRQRTPVISSSFQQTSLKQYIKSLVLLRTEGASYQLSNLSLRKSVDNLDKVRETLHNSNQRYQNIQQDVLATFVDRGQLQELRQPTISPTGRRTPGLRLEDLRLLALWQALTCFIHTLGHGTFRTRDLLPEAQRVLNRPDYKLSQLRYDLGKLRGKRLVQRQPNTQSYTITSEGFRLAVFYSKIYHRLLAPVTSGILEPIPADNRVLSHREVKVDRFYRLLDEHLERLTTFLGLAA